MTPARFGVAYFWWNFAGHTPVGVMHARRLRSYEPGAGRTAFSGIYDLRGTLTYRTTVPICLMSDPATKLACVQVRLVGDDAEPGFEVTPIPINDPRVTPHTITWAPTVTTTPECAACV
jgi:hypothetical protein